MGESAAETVTEIEQTRDRIEHNLRRLEDRLPPPALIGKRAVGVAVGGGIGGTIALRALKRMRRKAKKNRATHEHTTVVQLVPDGVAESIKDVKDAVARSAGEGRWKGWLAGAGVAWLLVRGVELRRLRSLNRALLRP